MYILLIQYLLGPLKYGFGGALMEFGLGFRAFASSGTPRHITTLRLFRLLVTCDDAYPSMTHAQRSIYAHICICVCV